MNSEEERVARHERQAAEKLVTRRFSTAQVSGSEAVKYVRRINRSWITRGNLAQNTENYLNYLAARRPGDLHAVCEAAVQAAKNASLRQQDPKPYFYASIFSRATREERNEFLKEHFYTRVLSAELQLNNSAQDSKTLPTSHPQQAS